ncbi:LytTR family transcriptional regulator [Ilyomonas limi]|uniref:LytTR family transcriptional regulator n=1 Tax=Ilyomonas limi TaxID=2575867 RepID=A0A4U3KVK4_9BACT|nr:LytTR family DNA-binding domain-containing protein [Ilyomonas limi]TKK66372.1 LytTR family transcriptional regulator [Ilyomonas limi]
MMTTLMNEKDTKKRTRILVKKGVEYILLKLEDVVFFYTEEKLVFAIDKMKQKYVVDKNLSMLEAGLDNTVFFRANRKYIVNINFVKGYKPYQKVKLIVDMTLPDLNHSIIVSQETAPYFRKWIAEM